MSSVSRLAFVVALLVLAGACGLLSSDAEVEVLVSVSDLQTHPSAPVDIHVTVANFGPGPVEVQGHSCPPTYDVFDRHGDLVGPPPVLCAAVAIAPRTLRAAEAFTFEHSWAGETFREGQDIVVEGVYGLEEKVWVKGFGLVRSRPVEIQVVTPEGVGSAR